MAYIHSPQTKQTDGQLVRRYHPDLLQSQLFMLKLSGVLPPIIVHSCKWKSLLYDAYTIISIISHVPFFMFQIMGVYTYRGNLQIAIGIVFQMMVCFEGLVILIYFTYHRKYLLKIIEMLETRFLPHIQKVGSPQKQDAIMRGTRKISNILMILLIATFVVVISAWCVLPLFVKYFSYEQEIQIGNSTIVHKEHFEYFVIAMWMPVYTLTFPTYELLYASQLFYIWVVVTNFTAGNMVFISIFYGISIKFTLLASAIEDIDYICVDNKGEDGVRTKKTSLSSNVFEREAYEEESLQGNICLQQSEDVFPLKRLIEEQSEARDVSSAIRMDTTDGYQIATNQSRYVEIQYMIECIKFHQDLLKFCNEVDYFLSPLLLIYIVMYEAMICVPLYQVVLGEGDNIFRFLTSAVDAPFLALTICWSGEKLSRESMSVQKAAYGCRWYNRSHSLKKLLQIIIMRTKEPVRMTAGKFFVISLETFANVANKVFAYFTVLKNMQDSDE